MYETYGRMILLCAVNYWWKENSSLEYQDCREFHWYIKQSGDNDQVWTLSKFDQ